jgi:hypothetical protein
MIVPDYNKLKLTLQRLEQELKNLPENHPDYAVKFKAYQNVKRELESITQTLN